MLILADTNDKLQVISGQAVTLDVVSCYADISSSTFAISDVNKILTAISTATTTDIVGSPGATTRRNVKSVNIRNKHASLACDVTVQFNDNATLYEMHKATLQPGDCLEYVEGVGWFVVAASSSPLERMFKLGSDVSNSTTTAAEVTGWLPVAPTTGLGSFIFEWYLIHQAAAATTGIKFSINHTGTVTQFVYWVEQSSATTTASDGIQDQDIVLATGGLINVNAARAKGTGGLGASVSVDTANADMLTVIRGICTVTVDGDIELWHGSEVAAATTVKAGSALRLARAG
jgi:hypothetical protein